MCLSAQSQWGPKLTFSRAMFFGNSNKILTRTFLLAWKFPTSGVLPSTLQHGITTSLDEDSLDFDGHFWKWVFILVI